MESKVKLLGHPIHQMLIVFPLGLLATSFFFDIIGPLSGDRLWYEMAFYLIAAGIIGGLLAAVFGLLDWLTITSGTRAKRIGLLHGGGNVVVVAIFAVNWLLRLGEPRNPSSLCLILSLIAVGLALVTGWLGGELVDRLGVGVDKGAHLNAPSSLSGRPATDEAEPNGTTPFTGKVGS
jgi:uncharacterized membrane protein